MDRREFLKSTVATAALGATGTLPRPMSLVPTRGRSRSGCWRR